MNKKERSAKLVSKFENVLRCPVCKESMSVFENRSLICTNNHTFDFAKQGYVNLATRPGKSLYDKKLFEARHEIITKSNLYELLHEQIIEAMNTYMELTNGANIVLDAGCGEGSHLSMIADKWQKSMIGVGLDISKEGIRMAAKQYPDRIWLVGDLAESPLATQSCHTILNILSPANYMDFKRILRPEGLLIKIVPSTKYLAELRQALYDNSDAEKYHNEDIIALFQQHFKLIDIIQLHYTKTLTEAELEHLVQMAPLAWNATKEKINRFTNQDRAEITVALDILVGKNFR